MLESIGAAGATLRALEIQSAYAARIAVLQRETLSLEGDLALKLLRTASLPPEMGQHLDVQI